MDRWDWLLVVASVLLGLFASLAIEVLRGQLERWQRRRDRREDFQRQTLLDLQDALYRFMLGMNLIRENIQRAAAGERDREWKALGDPGEMMQEAAPRIALLIERVDDKQLRDLVGDFMTGYSLVFPSSRSEQKAVGTLDALHGIQLRANKRIGELLRKL